MKKFIFIIFIIALISLTLFLINSAYADKDETISATTPEEAVRLVIEYAKASEYDKVKQLIDMEMSFKEKADNENYFNDIMLKFTHNNSITTESILGSSKEGVRAVVRYQIKYEGSDMIRGTMDLIQKNKSWFIIYDENRLDEIPEPDKEKIVGTWYCKSDDFSYYIIEVVKEGKVYKIRDKRVESDIFFDKEIDKMIIDNKPSKNYTLDRKNGKDLTGDWFYNTDNLLYEIKISKKSNLIYNVSKKISVTEPNKFVPTITEENTDYIYDSETNKLYNRSFGNDKIYEDQFVWRKLGGTLTGEKVDTILKPTTYYSDIDEKVYYLGNPCTRLEKGK